MSYSIEDKYRNIYWFEHLDFFWKYIVRSQVGGYFGALLRLYLIELNKSK